MSGTLVAVYLFSVVVVLFVAWRLLAELKELAHCQERQARALERIAVASEQWAFRYVRRKKKSEAKEAETP
jgi:hypothetical protein